MAGALKANLVAGLLVLTPAVVSVYVFVQLFLFLDRPLGTAVRRLTGLRLPGVGLGALLVLTFMAGLFTRNLVGNQVVKLAKSALSSVPLVGKLYGVLEQTLGILLTGKGKGFRHVVLVEYPVQGVWALGLVAGEGLGGEQPPLVRVFVPTSPNPTTGFVLMAPPEKLKPVSLTVEEALKVLVSGGLVLPSSAAGGAPQGEPAP